mmetsp:Transcript_41681/g.96367  ORF Transcript_41681/g.96367 Transcript_41681/m.96367 type:complete len:338 (+) Transcript_41681:1410-2423(+)
MLAVPVVRARATRVGVVVAVEVRRAIAASAEGPGLVARTGQHVVSGGGVVDRLRGHDGAQGLVAHFRARDVEQGARLQPAHLLVPVTVGEALPDVRVVRAVAVAVERHQAAIVVVVYVALGDVAHVALHRMVVRALANVLGLPASLHRPVHLDAPPRDLGCPEVHGVVIPQVDLVEPRCQLVVVVEPDPPHAVASEHALAHDGHIVKPDVELVWLDVPVEKKVDLVPAVLLRVGLEDGQVLVVLEVTRLEVEVCAVAERVGEADSQHDVRVVLEPVPRRSVEARSDRLAVGVACAPLDGRPEHEHGAPRALAVLGARVAAVDFDKVRDALGALTVIG